MLTKLTHLHGILPILPCSSAVMVAMTTIVGSSSSSPEGPEPLPKKARFRAFLWVSSRGMYGVI
jgi:hypothetical protein